MPLQKLSEIEEKLQKDYIDIKKRYIKSNDVNMLFKF